MRASAPTVASFVPHVVARLVTINLALWGHLAWWLAVGTGLRRARITPAQRFAHVLEHLGTTFVKLGQGLSLHRELLSDEYVSALQKLQEHVEPFDPALARAEVEASFGRPVTELFARFNAEPLAAGSIAQVHGAVMHDGRPVVVKVRRPGIRRQVQQDVRILRWFVRSVLWLWPPARALRPLELVDELARNLRNEIDFRREAASIVRFAQMFAGSATVYVPGVVDDLYTDWVIVQDRSPGLRIDLPQFAAQGPTLAAHLVDAYLRQLIVEGLFHGDPHPGNLFVLDDGRICLHDFGLVGYLDRTTRLNLVAFMLAFVRQDSDWLLDAHTDLGLLAAVADRAALRRGVGEIMQEHARKPLRDWSLAEVMLRLTRLGGVRHARVPQHLLVLMRAMFLLESTVRRLDPAFNLIDGLFNKAGALLQTVTAAPAAPAAAADAAAADAALPADRLGYEALLSTQQMTDRLGAMLHRLRTEGLEIAVAHRGLQALDDDVRHVGSWVSQGLVAAGLFVAASLLLQADAGPRWLDVPVLPALGYAVAAWLTLRLLRSQRRAS